MTPTHAKMLGPGEPNPAKVAMVILEPHVFEEMVTRIAAMVAARAALSPPNEAGHEPT